MGCLFLRSKQERSFFPPSVGGWGTGGHHPTVGAHSWEPACALAPPPCPWPSCPTLGLGSVRGSGRCWGGKQEPGDLAPGTRSSPRAPPPWGLGPSLQDGRELWVSRGSDSVAQRFTWGWLHTATGCDADTPGPSRRSGWQFDISMWSLGVQAPQSQVWSVNQWFQLATLARPPRA